MRDNKYIKAFTLFEVTVVLAIMSIMLTIISVSLNRFNEQIKNSSEIHQELNHFYIVRSNLWRELYESDSLTCDQNTLQIYKGTDRVDYTIEDELLQRKSLRSEIENMNLAVESIKTVEKDGEQLIEIAFIWKEEIMKLSYLNKAHLDLKINRYFEELK
ncbi:MAG: hypothetical protein K0R65_2756 [Crocinitomicaceae bacterium]|jgi:prepilin-type N-terminal cleavage/methylation domain-containing protein|nr:hypothetical protein [Crocinitomicaceae bacterium]